MPDERAGTSDRRWLPENDRALCVWPSQHPFRQSQYRNVVYPASGFLRFRYGVTGISKEELIQRFKALGLWDSMVARFKELFSVLKNKQL
jgi:hypothetical protein